MFGLDASRALAAGREDWRHMLDESTPTGTQNATKSSKVSLSLSLSIIAHPDLRRIGDFAQVDFASGVELGRHTPVFEGRDGRTAPLNARYVSRTPVFLAEQERGLRTTGQLTVDGRSARGGLSVDAESLRNGVCISFRDRVALWVRVGPLVPASGFGGLPNNSFESRILQRTARRLALLSSPLLVIGTWRDYAQPLCEALHAAGPTADEPFLDVIGTDDPLPEGGGTLVVRDLELWQPAAAIRLVERLKGRRRLIGVVGDAEALLPGVRAAFDDELQMPKPLRFGDAMSYFGPALVERLEALQLSELIDRDPPWALPEDLIGLEHSTFTDPESITRMARRLVVESSTNRASFPTVSDGEETTTDRERRRLLNLLSRFDYRISVVARSEGISPNTLRRQMKELGVPVASELSDAQLRRAVDRVGSDLPAVASLLQVSLHGLRLRWADFTD